jgi:formyl-CoA transferase
VIQVLAPGTGDLSGSDAANLHRNKRSTIIDLKLESGRDILLRLVERADVLVENLRPPVKHRLRIDPDSLWTVNPGLIYASISGFGQDGPYASRPGVDQIAQGLGGLMSVTGPPGQGPWRVGIAIADTAAGTFLTQGVLAALIARQRTGRGQWVHTSLLETMINLMDFQAARWLIDKDVPGQAGNQHPTMFPTSGATFPTADGYINLAPLTGFEQFCSHIGAPELALDARFADPAARRSHRAELEAAIGRRMIKRTTDEWVEQLAAEMPCGPVLGVDEVFADPQVQHLHVTRTVEHPVKGPIEVLRGPLTWSDTPASVRSGPPVPGSHTREVLAELGYEEGEISGLVDDGTVRTSNPGEGWAAH